MSKIKPLTDIAPMPSSRDGRINTCCAAQQRTAGEAPPPKIDPDKEKKVLHIRHAEGLISTEQYIDQLIRNLIDNQ